MLLEDKKSLFVILFVVLIIFLIMLPLRPVIAGNDFSLLLTVRRLVNTGELFIYSHPSASIVSQILWGAAFAKIFGFSIPLMHFSVFLFLPILAIFFYLFLRAMKIDSAKSLILSLFLLSIPWYIRYAFGFRTDLTYTSMQVVSIYFYYLGLKKEKFTYLILGSIIASIAFLTRQLGIVLAIGCFIGIILTSKYFQKNAFKTILASILFPVLTAIFYSLWLNWSNNLTITNLDFQNKFISSIKEILPFTSVSLEDRLFGYKTNFHRALDYFSQTIGLFFPIMVLFLISNFSFFKKFLLKNFKIFTLTLSFISSLYLFDIILFPKGVTLGFPIIIYESEKLFPIPWAHIWKIIVGFSIVFWSIFFSLALTKINLFKKEFIFLLILLLGLISITIFSIFLHDQYIMPILPIVLIFFGLVSKNLQVNKILATIVLAFLILDSIQITKLIYDENGIAQAKATELVALGATPADILPGKNHPWHLWYDYEELEKKEIERIGGNRRIAKAQGLVMDKYKYIISPQRDLTYLEVKLENPQIEKINFRSFLVNGELLFIKNNAKAK